MSKRLSLIGLKTREIFDTFTHNRMSDQTMLKWLEGQLQLIWQDGQLTGIRAAAPTFTVTAKEVIPK